MFTNLNLPNSVFLIADSVSLNCSSGLKEFKTSTLQEPLKACARFVVLYFLVQKVFTSFCITISRAIRSYLRNFCSLSYSLG